MSRFKKFQITSIEKSTNLIEFQETIQLRISRSLPLNFPLSSSDLLRKTKKDGVANRRNPCGCWYMTNLVVSSCTKINQQSFSLLKTNVTCLDCAYFRQLDISYRKNAVLKRVSAREKNRQGLFHYFLDWRWPGIVGLLSPEKHFVYFNRNFEKLFRLGKPQIRLRKSR